MNKQTVLDQLKKYISGQWGDQNKELAQQLCNITEKDISFANPTYIIGCDTDYSCTGRGCIVNQYEERYFPLTKNFKTSFELYKGDGAGVERYHKDISVGNILKALPYNENNIVLLLEADAYKKLKSEFSMYNAIAERVSIKINDYTCHERTSYLCPYTPIYAMLKDANGQSKQKLIGYIKTENGTETLEIGIEEEKSENKKSMGCMVIGLGILCPPILIAYGLYLCVKKVIKKYI
ncbi:MAG: hypothetical protein IJA86_01365 [Clostridia bacterium]|nr:hypothetical protein [Clostridia bacterium]